MTSSDKPTGNQLKTSRVTVIVSGESDFTSDAPSSESESCYGPPLGANASGGFRMGYDHAVQVVDFQGMYFFESSCLQPSYANSMPHDHPLDSQGHIASTPHSGTAAYSLYIGLVTSGIPITVKVGNKDTHHYYFDVFGIVPVLGNHHIWGSLHFLPLCQMYSSPSVTLGPFCPTWKKGNTGLISWAQTALTCTKYAQLYQVFVVAFHMSEWV